MPNHDEVKVTTMACLDSVVDPLVAEIARVSRTLGADPDLVLQGGGNSSVKSVLRDLTGESIPVIHVKGSGLPMAAVGPTDFAPLRLDRLRRLLPPVVVPEDELANELRCALLRADAADPSVETLVHVLLPQTAVLHSHADALLALGNSTGGAERITGLFADDCVIVDYAMPGPALVSACAAAWQAQATDRTIGMIVLGHGLFTIGDTPDQALERHLALVSRARAALPHLTPLPDPLPADLLPADEFSPDGVTEPDTLTLVRLRREVSELAGRPLVMRRDTSPEVRAFAADQDLVAAIARGPLTPDHVIWTRYRPMIGPDVAGYAEVHRAWFRDNLDRTGRDDVTMLDAAPRVVLDPELGMLTFGRNGHEAAATAEITKHTMRAVRQAEALGGYRPASPDHVFDLEYWAPQQAKLRRSDAARPLIGQVALVTGAASGIGRGCAEALLAAGASVVGWDMSESVASTFDDEDYLGIRVDVTDHDAVAAALAQQFEVFGGLDVLVVAAGIFPTSANLGDLSMQAWRRTMAVNLDSVADLYGQAHPALANAVPHGRVILIASKNVKAPGPGASAYSASKAGVAQLTRVAALEWAADRIRVNMIHPDAVFDTGLWTPDLLAARAEHYGMSVEDYKRRNLMHTEITSAAVGRLALTMASDAFACTTGAQVPIDGGNERVI